MADTPGAIGHAASGAAVSKTSVWLIPWFFALLGALSYVDRFILALLAVHIIRDLDLSDQQMGLLIGAGFSIVYPLASMPLAHLIDRGPRRTVLVLCVLSWSALTVASGFASSFLMLALCRAGVAIGESALSPAAISIIGEAFPEEKRALPMSIYSSISSIMPSGSFVVSGAAYALAVWLEPHLSLEPWRGTFVLVGLPGLLFALAALFVLPKGRALQASQVQEGESATFRAFLDHVNQRRSFYSAFFLALSMMGVVTYSFMSWIPTLLVRGYGQDSATSGYLIGAVCAPMGVLGAFLWPLLTRWFDRNGRRDGLLRATIVAGLLLAPAAILGPLGSTWGQVLLGMSVVVFACASSSVLSFLAVQAFGPAQMQGRLIALLSLCINLLGFALGAFIVPTFAAFWPNDPHAIGKGLASLSLIACPLIIGLYYLAFRCSGSVIPRMTSVSNTDPNSQMSGRIA